MLKSSQVLAASLFAFAANLSIAADAPLDIGSRRELFVDDALHLAFAPGKMSESHPRFCCYAESADGIHWRKPDLGLHEFQSSRSNNIVITSGKSVGLDAVRETMGSGAGINPDAAHPAVFKDENPKAAADARYKAIIRSNSPKGCWPSNRRMASIGRP
jgi:hypothetical protein